MSIPSSKIFLYIIIRGKATLFILSLNTRETETKLRSGSNAQALRWCWSWTRKEICREKSPNYLYFSDNHNKLGCNHQSGHKLDISENDQPVYYIRYAIYYMLCLINYMLSTIYNILPPEVQYHLFCALICGYTFTVDKSLLSPKKLYHQFRETYVTLHTMISKVYCLPILASRTSPPLSI